MGEYGELPVEHTAGAEATHDRGHSCAHVDVKAGLGTVAGFDVNDRLLGSAGELQATPGYPAPLTACMVTAMTVSRPKR